MGHTIRTRGFRGMHLRDNRNNFLLHKGYHQFIMHFSCDFALHSIKGSFISMSSLAVKSLAKYLWNTLSIYSSSSQAVPSSSRILEIWFRLFLSLATRWIKKHVFLSPSTIQFTRDCCKQTTSSFRNRVTILFSKEWIDCMFSSEGGEACNLSRSLLLLSISWGSS